MSTAGEDIEIFEEEPSGFARWIAPALIISVLLHVIFYMWARGYPFQPFSEDYYDQIVPRTFRLDRVDIDPRLLEPEAAEEVKQAAAPTAVELPRETVSLGAMDAEVKFTPAAPEIENPMLADRPSPDQTTFQDVVQKAEVHGTQTVVEDLNALREELLRSDPVSSGRPLLDLGPTEAESGSPSGEAAEISGGATKGFSNLDSLLAQTGPLTNETAPILMPADLLFDYDSSAVRPSAVPSLEKLGIIVRRNPNADFTIEGHTDSFGGEEYNFKLSQQRAESVKAWLVQFMNIDPSRIRTRGFGMTRLIAPASGGIDEQQINRRVEIVIHAKPEAR